MKKCAVIVNSCDKNIDLLDNFFDLFRRFWRNCPYQVFLNVERTEYKTDHVQTVVCNQNISWCRRLRKCVEKSEAKYVILLLDDFYFEDAVKQNLLDDVISYMEQNESIISFCFDTIPMDSEKSQYTGYLKRKARGKYRHCLQAGIWRSDYLLSALDIEASPWDFEVTYNFVSYGDEYEFYCAKDREVRPFTYNSGYLVYKGKYVKEEVEKFESEFGIHFDKSQREVIERKDAIDYVTPFRRILRRANIIRKQLLMIIRKRVIYVRR